MRARAVLSIGSLIALGVALGACESASPSPGLDALLQIVDSKGLPGQFRPGPFPHASGGPPIVGAQLDHIQVRRGGINEKLDASFDGSAHAAIIGLDGVEGSWIFQTTPGDSDMPDSTRVRLRYGLTEEVEPGPFTVLVAGTDPAGRIGEAATLLAVAAEDAPIPGTLVISLVWTGRADLDLHVVDPLGGEAYSDDPSTWDPKPSDPPHDPSLPEPYTFGGNLDHDGNGGCRTDVSNEHVIWTQPPPSGDYVIRVDTRSLCGDPDTQWYVDAFRDVTPFDTGTALGAARGLATAASVLEPHRSGAGELALRFTLP